ncbi:MAG: hypothetical protein H6670_04305 [Anaerolineaceae bacterium]|nr:hypothetical protein [Anaerolineaceae bacterium]
MRFQARFFSIIYLLIVVGLFSTATVAAQDNRDDGENKPPIATASVDCVTRGVVNYTALLLESPQTQTQFAPQYCELARFLGIDCQRVDITQAEALAYLLTLLESQPFPLIGINAATLDLLPVEWITALNEAAINGSHVLLYEMNTSASKAARTAGWALTGGALQDIIEIHSGMNGWTFTDQLPEMTREFTDHTLTIEPREEAIDSAVIWRPEAHVRPIMQVVANDGSRPTVFSQVPIGEGSILVNSAAPLLDQPLRELYYYDSLSSRMLPLVFAFKYAYGDMIWHNTTNYANLTLDDPRLTEPFFLLSYYDLLEQMDFANFHTTIAAHPGELPLADSDVVSLIVSNPDRYSIVQHGYLGDGYEFYYYDRSAPDYNPTFPPRPFVEQLFAIESGLRQLILHRSTHDLLFGRIMVFPYGISPAGTFTLLKERNYLATINGQNIPLGESYPDDWAYAMAPAIMRYESFPMIVRRDINYYPETPQVDRFIRELYLDRPALFYTHTYVGELFTSGMDAFNPVAEEMNGLYGDLQWASLQDIVQHLYWEKDAPDGIIDVQMYVRTTHISNDSSVPRTYCIRKTETQNVPISWLRVNGQELPYQIVDDELVIGLEIPAGATATINVHYGYQGDDD